MHARLNLKEKIERYLRDFRDLYLRNYKHEKLPQEIFAPTLEKRSISFCTTCMNRFFHLKQTFLKNVHDNQQYPNVEFVLLNYNSQDELHDWAKETLPSYIDKGIVNYYHTTVPQVFHASIAKNLAHKVAKGDIVVNLDGDNFTGRDFAYYVNYAMHKHGDNALLQFKKAPYWGTEGRIVMLKKHFLALGGYDEALDAIGHEDHDLMDRAKAMGLEYTNIQIENFLHYLSNTTKEKAENCAVEPDNYYGYESRNRMISKKNIEEGKLRANPDGWGMFPLYKNFSKEAIIYP